MGFAFERARIVGFAVLVVAALVAGTTANARSTPHINTPPAGSKVADSFVFAGRTEPNAIVTINAATDDGSTDPQAPPAFTKRTRADRRGSFSVEIVLPKLKRYVHVHVLSVAPDGSVGTTAVVYPTTAP